MSECRYDRIRCLFALYGDRWMLVEVMSDGEWEAGGEIDHSLAYDADATEERWLLVPRDWIQSYMRSMDISSAPGANLLPKDNDDDAPQTNPEDS